MLRHDELGKAINVYFHCQRLLPMCMCKLNSKGANVKQKKETLHRVQRAVA